MIYVSENGTMIAVATCGTMHMTRSLKDWARDDLHGLLDHTRCEGARSLASTLKDHIDSGMAAAALYQLISKVASAEDVQ